MSQLADLSEVKAQFEAGDYQGASEALGRLLLASPDHADAQVMLAESLLRLQRWDAGLSAVDRLIELMPSATLGHRMRCVALENLERYDEAIASARTAIAIDGAEANSYFLLAKGLMHLGRDPEARAALEMAARLEPDVPLYRFTLANLLFEAVPSVAEALLERIIADEPTHAIALNNLGVLKQNKRELAVAEALYRRAFEADPKLELARQNRDRLASKGIQIAGWLILSALLFGLFGAGPFFLGRRLDGAGHSAIAGAVWGVGGLACLICAAALVQVFRKDRRAVPLRA